MEREIRFRFASHLLSGERILWVGRPGQRFRFRGRDVYEVLSGVFSAAIILYLAGLDSHDRPIQIFVSISFGLWISFFGFKILYEAWMRGRTFYAITDHRALFLCIGIGDRPRLTSIDRSQIVSVEQAGSDARGTIYFAGAAEQKRTLLDKILNLAPDRRFHFLKISQPNQVFRLLQGQAVGSPVSGGGLGP